MATKDYRIKRIEAIQRATAVLGFLDTTHGASLKQLHQSLDIAKPTLLRVLATLRDEGFVWQRLSDGAWALSLRHQKIVSLLRPYWLAELVSPVLEALSKQVPWPSQVSIPVEDAVEVIESNYSQAFIDPLPPNSTGFLAPLLRSASGRAWFSFASPDRQQGILRQLEISDLPAHALARDRAAVMELIADTQRRGYAFRATDFGGAFNRPRSEVDDGRDSLALPIRIEGHAIAAMNFTWKNQVVDRARIVQMHIDPLAKAVEQIEQAARSFLAQRQWLH